ncbi:MAG: UDP-N-acetyl glucosamine 2-epimerase [Lysobacteraceae bacterium]|nr:MAG: UDP-N-acetyl glucosamine 2-epimerase [Xanthomonadaceae bacterium]
MKKIAVVTTSRAEYGHLICPLRAIRESPQLQLQLIVTGAHLSRRFGYTKDLIEADGFEIDRQIETLVDSDSDVGMAKTIGTMSLGLTDALADLRPDLLLLIADRYEMLAPASVALALRIPIAHIEGGEVSRGAVDDAVRNALTKLSHLHFTTTELARERVISMGEQPWRVIRSGAPSLDNLVGHDFADSKQLARTLGHELPSSPVAVISMHPTTLADNTLEETGALFSALQQFDDLGIIFCFPNADAGSRELAEQASAFCLQRANAHLHTHIPHLDYLSLLKHADLMVGNSSSGIMESASFKLPTVDIGRRQLGRERAENVITCRAETDDIVNGIRKARDEAFRQSIRDVENPYGDGRASERIVQVLTQLPDKQRLLDKVPT